MADIIQRAGVSAKDAFEEFDESNDGSLQRDEFEGALVKLGCQFTNEETNMLWQSLDADNSGGVDYFEFVRKLERFGLQNKSSDEMLIVQMIEAAKRA